MLFMIAELYHLPYITYYAGNLSLLVQLRYNEKHVPIKPNTVGNADQKISAADRVRTASLLPGMSFTKGREI
jgi:hypothetical protein